MRRLARVGLVLSLFCLGTSAALAGDGLAQTPPMGWNSWNKFGCNVSEKLVRGAADAMVSSGMKAAGYSYVVIDDCWQTGRDAHGTIVADPARFPSGMKALAAAVHAKGLKLGIYSDAGTMTCAKRPGSKDHEAQDAKTYAAWGVDYLKYDWCNTEGQDTREAYLKMSRALRASGNDLLTMTPEVRDILTNREVIAVDQDALGMQGRKVRDDGAHEVWMKPLADGSRAVILFNRGTEDAPIAASWDEIGLFPGAKARVRDVWRRADVGIATGRYEAKVAPHGVVMVRIAPQ